MAAQRRPRRLGRRLVGGEARHALDRSGGLLDGAPGEGALDQLLEPRDDGGALVVAVAAEEIEDVSVSWRPTASSVKDSTRSPRVSSVPS